MGFCNMISFMVQVLTQWAWYKMHVSAFLCEIPLKQESCIIHRFSCMTTYNILFITVYFYICKGDQSMNKDMDQLFPFKKNKEVGDTEPCNWTLVWKEFIYVKTNLKTWCLCPNELNQSWVQTEALVPSSTLGSLCLHEYSNLFDIICWNKQPAGCIALPS